MRFIHSLISLIYFCLGHSRLHQHQVAENNNMINNANGKVPQTNGVTSHSCHKHAEPIKRVSTSDPRKCMHYLSCNKNRFFIDVTNIISISLLENYFSKALFSYSTSV